MEGTADVAAVIVEVTEIDGKTSNNKAEIGWQIPTQGHVLVLYNKDLLYIIRN